MSASVERVHGDGCACTRCVGFLPGNELRTRHGAYASELRLSTNPRHAEIADGLRERLPIYAVADEPAVQLLSTALLRIEKASAALDEIDQHASGDLAAYIVGDAGKVQRLREDLRGWINTSMRLVDALGMTPTSRARLGLDLVRAEDALGRLEAEGRAIRERRDAVGARG